MHPEDPSGRRPFEADPVLHVIDLVTSKQGCAQPMAVLEDWQKARIIELSEDRKTVRDIMVVTRIGERLIREVLEAERMRKLNTGRLAPVTEDDVFNDFPVVAAAVELAVVDVPRPSRRPEPVTVTVPETGTPDSPIFPTVKASAEAAEPEPAVITPDLPGEVVTAQPAIAEKTSGPIVLTSPPAAFDWNDAALCWAEDSPDAALRAAAAALRSAIDVFLAADEKAEDLRRAAALRQAQIEQAEQALAAARATIEHCEAQLAELRAAPLAPVPEPTPSNQPPGKVKGGKRHISDEGRERIRQATIARHARDRQVREAAAAALSQSN